MSFSNGISLKGDVNQSLYRILLTEQKIGDLVTKYGVMNKVTDDVMKALKTTYVTLLPKPTSTTNPKTIGDLFKEKGIMAGDNSKYFCEYVSVYDSKDAACKLKVKVNASDTQLKNWLYAVKSKDVYKISDYLNATEVRDEVALAKAEGKTSPTDISNEITTYIKTDYGENVISIAKGNPINDIDKDLYIAIPGDESGADVLVGKRINVEIDNMNLGSNNHKFQFDTTTNANTIIISNSNLIGSDFTIKANNEIVLDKNFTAAVDDLQTGSTVYGKVTNLTIQAKSIVIRDCNLQATGSISITGETALIIDGSYIKSPSLTYKCEGNPDGLVITNSQLLIEN